MVEYYTDREVLENDIATLKNAALILKRRNKIVAHEAVKHAAASLNDRPTEENEIPLEERLRKDALQLLDAINAPPPLVVVDVTLHRGNDVVAEISLNSENTQGERNG